MGRCGCWGLLRGAGNRILRDDLFADILRCRRHNLTKAVGQFLTDSSRWNPACRAGASLTYSDRLRFTPNSRFRPETLDYRSGKLYL